MQQHFEHELAAEVAEHEQQRAGEDPAQRGAAAPAVAPAAEEQRAEGRASRRPRTRSCA